MSDTLRLVLVSSSLVTVIFIITRIRKHKLNIEDAIAWLVWSVLLVLASLFPNGVQAISKTLGFLTPNNFIFTAFIFYLYIINFFNTIKISELKEKNKKLVQRLSLDAKDKK